MLPLFLPPSFLSSVPPNSVRWLCRVIVRLRLLLSYSYSCLLSFFPERKPAFKLFLFPWPFCPAELSFVFLLVQPFVLRILPDISPPEIFHVWRTASPDKFLSPANKQPEYECCHQNNDKLCIIHYPCFLFTIGFLNFGP